MRIILPSDLQETNVITASRTGKRLPFDSSRITTVTLDASIQADLDAQIAAHDLVISLLPYEYHPAVIKSAVKGKTNVVTTSYVSPAMRELEAQVREAGIVVMNEVGVDPGVDHLYAVKAIDQVHAKGGKVSYLVFR